VRKFAFKLEKSLRLRAWNEEAARFDLGRAVGELNALERELEILAEKRVTTMTERSSSIRTANEFNLYESYFARLDAEKENLLVRITQAKLNVETAQEIWTTAKAELQTMENLKERKIVDYRKEIFAEEEKETSEIYTRQAGLYESLRDPGH
jgi:flagellar export protein FliJ